MFVVAFALVALGYTAVYYGASMAKAYNAVHDQNLSPNAKGGIPFGVLLGVGKAQIGTSQEALGDGQSYPPLVTGTENARPKGQ